MELINATRMVAGYTLGIEPSGREFLVVVVKGTFRMPGAGEEAHLHAQQQPLVFADTFTGEPGLSAPCAEADFALRKPRCDILLHGTAYAPGGRPATRVPVGIRIGGWSKTFAVVGDRHWQAGLGGITASEPEPFTAMPVSYDRAFGGVDTRHADPARHAAFLRNPAGRGFHHHLDSAWVDGTPLPNTEDLGHPVTAPDGDYAPMAFGPVGRGWEPRRRLAGTYDEKWLDEHCPFLPPDFSDAYYQAAPADQQLDAPPGGQEVVLVNLGAEGTRAFVLPDFTAPVHIVPRRGPREELHAALDTLLFEPDLDRFSMTWRVARPLKNNLFEIGQVLVGRKGPEWWQQREQVAFPIPVVMVPLAPA